MISIFMQVMVIPEQLEEWTKVVHWLTDTTLAEDEGCITYTWYKNTGNSQEYILHEQWNDETALKAHVERLQRHFGKPREGTRLPEKLLSYFENVKGARYEPAE